MIAALAGIVAAFIAYPMHCSREPSGSEASSLTAAPSPPAATENYAWSVRSPMYHYASCRYVAQIKPENLRTGATPPDGKTLHVGCPQWSRMCG